MHFRLTAATGQVLDEGEARAEMQTGVLVVSPDIGQPIRVRPADVAEVSEPAPFVVRLRLREGPALDLSQMGAMRTQLLAQLGDARVDDTVDSLLLRGLGKPERFPGAANEVEAEIRLYEDTLVAVPVSGEPVQIPFSFVESVTTDASGYRVTVAGEGGETLVLNRMARRTDELVKLLREKVSAARSRTGAFLGEILPGLGPIAARSAAALLRDGVAAWKTDLDAVDATIWPALVTAATRQQRAAGVETLQGLGDCAIGFSQRISVTQDAQGVKPWRDSAVQPVLDHGGTPTMPGGMAGMMGAGMMAAGGPFALGFDAAFGGEGMGGMALGMLGMGMLGSTGVGAPSGTAHQPQGRPDVSRGTLTPESTDSSQLTLAGGGDDGNDPVVLAFVLCHTGTRLVYEVLNVGDHASYVYDAPDRDAVRRLNRALMLIDFHVPAVYQDAQSAGSQYRRAAERLPELQVLRTAFRGRAIHTDGWEQQLRGLL